MILKCGIPEKEYSIIHAWLRRKFGAATKCENPTCKHRSKKYHYALIKGQEYAKDRNRFMMLCISCHLSYDWDESKRTSMRIVTNERRNKIGIANKGKKRTPDQILSMSERNKGEKNPFFGKGIKGERNPCFGKRHSIETKIKIFNTKAKLNSEQVAEIRKLRNIGIDQKTIATLFNVSRASVCRIVNNKRYIL